MATRDEFQAALDAAGITSFYEPHRERDGEYLYESYVSDDGREIAFVAWLRGEPSYTVHLSVEREEEEV